MGKSIFGIEEKPEVFAIKDGIVYGFDDESDIPEGFSPFDEDKAIDLKTRRLT